MRTKWVVTTAVVAISAMSAVRAQTPKKQSNPVGGDAMSRTYTGCVESFNHGAAFLLTKVHDSDPVGGSKTTAQPNDTSNKSDTNVSVQSGQMPPAQEVDTEWKAFVLAGSSDLSAQVGHKVSVTASASDRSTAATRQDVLMVKSLKVIAASCS